MIIVDGLLRINNPNSLECFFEVISGKLNGDNFYLKPNQSLSFSIVNTDEENNICVSMLCAHNEKHYKSCILIPPNKGNKGNKGNK